MLTSGTKRLSWGRGGTRSNNRHGKVYDVTSKNAQRIRLAKLVDFLHNMEENGNEVCDLSELFKYFTVVCHVSCDSWHILSVKLLFKRFSCH